VKGMARKTEMMVDVEHTILFSRSRVVHKEPKTKAHNMKFIHLFIVFETGGTARGRSGGMKPKFVLFIYSCGTGGTARDWSGGLKPKFGGEVFHTI
jgi:hypothetical protein